MQINSKPTVSVIIPAYNGARHICESIESILNQTYQQFEIIVVDDGSKDNTKRVLEPYIRNSSIRYYYQENAGHGAARNTGIKWAQGTYVCFHDQDDWLEKDSIERRLHLYEKYPELGLVCSDFRTAYMRNDYKQDVRYAESYVKKYDMINRIPTHCIAAKNKEFSITNKNIFSHFILECFIWIGTVMIRKEVFDDIGYFDEEMRYSPDIDLFIRIASKFNTGYLDTSTAIYRQHADNMSLNLYGVYEDVVKIGIKYLDPRWGLQDEDMKRTRKHIADYCSRKAHILIGTQKHFSAVNDIFKWIKYAPLSLRSYLYLLYAIMPPKIVAVLRSQKEKLIKNHDDN